MNLNSLQKLAGNTDIYLLDQIMKGRYEPGDKILDAGCGSGRNMYWFLRENMDVYGVDQNPGVIEELRIMYASLAPEKLQISSIENLPFVNNFFDHVISSAVLHFAVTFSQFNNMVSELVRVLKPGGSLFIRMTSDMGIEENVIPCGDGVYRIPDRSKRFLLTQSLLTGMLHQFSLSFLEPFKTVNVENVRCMSTLVLQKN
ncbi:MAG: class I SAM-dependent methyltransferase [Chitinophagaceae bacterium]